MQAVKFRGPENFERILDILMNRRLFCAPWSKLNDPMEGIFAYSYKKEEENQIKLAVKGIVDAKRKYRVCSLASDYQFHLMWAHYASGFSGVAIVLDLPDSDSRVREVRYRGVFDFLTLDGFESEQAAAENILFSKYQEWEYEREIRILTETEYYDLQKRPKLVVAGQRMDPNLFEILYRICKRERIPIARVGIGDEGIDADRIDESMFRHSGRRANRVG